MNNIQQLASYQPRRTATPELTDGTSYGHGRVSQLQKKALEQPQEKAPPRIEVDLLVEGACKDRVKVNLLVGGAPKVAVKLHGPGPGGEALRVQIQPYVESRRPLVSKFPPRPKGSSPLGTGALHNSAAQNEANRRAQAAQHDAAQYGTGTFGPHITLRVPLHETPTNNLHLLAQMLKAGVRPNAYFMHKLDTVWAPKVAVEARALLRKYPVGGAARQRVDSDYLLGRPSNT